MTMKSNAKFKEKLTCGLENNMRIWQIFTRVLEKFEGKVTCTFKNDMRNLANFHRLKNGSFIFRK